MVPPPTDACFIIYWSRFRREPSKGVGYKSSGDASTPLTGDPYVWSSRRDIFITCCHVMSCHHVTTCHQGMTCHYVMIKPSTR